MTAPGLRCVCGHTRYMHAPEDNYSCHVSDHLELVCACDGFREADPAVEAAQRAWEKNKVGSFLVQRVVAANEALKPIRELHVKRLIGTGAWYVCVEDGHEWPCDTAKLVYPESEL